MDTTIKIRPNPKELVKIDSHVQMQLCYKCGLCDSGCPMNLSTGLLRPRLLVSMASLGLIDELLHSPEIWHCLTCNRCTNNCPMLVKPSEIVLSLRWEALKNHIISYKAISDYNNFISKFQRVRWHMANFCIHSSDFMFDNIEQNFQTWMTKEVVLPQKTLNLNKITSVSGWIARETSSSLSCFTCNECSSVCPVSAGRDIFDPVWIFRMLNMGLLDELAVSPSIWLCLGCQRCTQTCSQGVRGHEIIYAIREYAISNGIIKQSFLYRWMYAQQKLDKYYQGEIDKLLFGEKT